MIYAPIFEIRIVHAYYEDGRCPSLALVATPETEALLRKHRCQQRTKMGSVIISAVLGPDGAPLLPLPVAEPLRFTMEAMTDEHLFVTDYSTISATAAPLFTNAAMAPGAGGNLALVAKASTRQDRRNAVIADIEIHCATSAPGQTPELVTYIVPLAAKRVYWAYYCLTDLANAETELHIVDETPAQDGSALVFRDEDRRKLNDAPDPSDRVGTYLVEQSRGLSCVRFVSRAPIVCLEAPRRYLALRLGTEKLSSPLPNPSLRRSSSIDLPIDAGATETCEVLTHLIEYRNYLTQTQN